MRLDELTRSSGYARIIICILLLSPGFASTGMSQDTSVVAGQKRPISLEDYFAIRSVGAPVVSPDGSGVVYVISQPDEVKDTTVSTLWYVDTDGDVPRKLTSGQYSVSSPAFSPDGSLVSFVTDRPGTAWGIDEQISERGQVYAMPLTGGEAFPLTSVEGGVRAYRWSPKGNRLAVVSMPPKRGPQENAAGRAVPIVVTRLKHKYDGIGYLDERTTRIYDVVIDTAIQSRGERFSEARLLSDAAYDSGAPSFSPDGRWIAYSSNRTPEPDNNMNTDIWKVELESGDTVRVTDYAGGDNQPVFSPDGKWIAYISSDPEWSMYPTPRVMVVAASGGEPHNLTGHLDRGAGGAPVWAPDSRSVYVTLADEGRTPLVQVGLDAKDTRVIEGNAGAPAISGNRLFVRYTKPDRPAEIYTASRRRTPIADSALTDLSRANGQHFAELEFNAAESLWFESTDGTLVHSWLLKPPGFEQSGKYPLLLWIHGGPVGQFTDGFNLTPQFLAAQGYVVLMVNPRGSSGYGEAFSRAIFADWGGPDYDDVMAGVDAVIEMGYVDPQRMGVGGYSYGGILTNYVIVKTDRFKGAISAASDADYYGAFGTDDWGIYWIHEFGEPWDNVDLYRQVSPTTYIKNAVTPTLFIHGGSDYRDPLTQSEQMYLSLRVLGVETGLVVYPGQSHGLGPPSYETDLLQRYKLWFDKYVKGESVDPLYHGFGEEHEHGLD